jgi:hypothetical protein
MKQKKNLLEYSDKKPYFKPHKKEDFISSQSYLKKQDG